jgi:hypothetical protein
LSTEGLFSPPASDADATAAAELARELGASTKTRLLPTSATAPVIANALQVWLTELRPEPLLTFKLIPALTSPETPRDSLKFILAELPAVNKNAFFMLLETCNRIASRAAINDTDASTLAASLGPCLLWRTTEPNADGEVGIQPLSRDEEDVFIRLLSYMISGYRTLL